jgi:hypothetical protein
LGLWKETPLGDDDDDEEGRGSGGAWRVVAGDEIGLVGVETYPLRRAVCVDDVSGVDDER